MELVVNGETISYSIKVQYDRNHVHREYFRASVIVSSNPATGSCVRKTITAPTEEQLRRKILALQQVRSLEDGALLPFQQYMESWMRHNRLRLKPTTFKGYEKYLQKYIYPYLGTYKMADLNEDIMCDFFNIIIDNYGLSTAYNIKAVLGRALREACEKHLTYGNVIAYVKLPKKQRDAIVPLSQNESQQLIQLCREDPLGGPIALTLLLGLRISECIGISLDCINFNRREIRIKRQINHVNSDYILQNSTKNNLVRNIYMNDVALEFIQRELTIQQRNMELAGDNWNNPYNCLFTDQFGGFIKHQTLRKHFKNLVAAIGRPDIKYHHLRHTAATIVHEQTNDVHLTKDLLGHKRYDSTGLYIHSSPEKKRQAALAISDYVSPET